MASRDYKTPTRSGRGRSGRAMVVGVAIGVVVGLGIALGVAIYLLNVPAPFLPRSETRTTPPATGTVPAPPARPAAAPPASPAPPAATDKPRFEFYGILAGKEQPVKEQDIRRSAPDKPKENTAYYLQVGAFQNANDADNLKARLALAGIEARIQTAEFQDGRTWHRVRLGPFESAGQVDAARTRLKENQMDATLLKVQEKRTP